MSPMSSAIPERTTAAAAGMTFERLDRCLLCGSARITAVDPSYNLDACLDCSYAFENPRPTLESIARFYSSASKYDSWIEAERARERLWKRRLRKFLAHANPGNLLDVGAGIGQFLYLARPHFTALYGTELSESGVRLAKQRYGLDLALGEIEALPFPEASFDNITLFHVLEHVPDAAATLQRCERLLRPGGVLLACVPNDLLAWTSRMKQFGRLLRLPPFFKFSPKTGLPRIGTSREIHLSHFTAPVLRRAVERAGLTVVHESIDPYYAAAGARLALHSAYHAVHRIIYILGVNSYDTIWMVAHKPAC